MDYSGDTRCLTDHTHRRQDNRRRQTRTTLAQHARVVCGRSCAPRKSAGVVMTEETLLTFPTEFPLKVMGLHNDDFRSVAIGIVRKHIAHEDVLGIEERPSKDGKY